MAERAQGSLRRRVALTTALAAALAAAMTAGATGLLSDRLFLAAEDARLRDAARVLEVELGEPGAAPAATADAEARELRDTGLRIALFAGSQRLGGDPALPPWPSDGCGTHAGSAPLRVCAATGRAGRVVAAIPLDRVIEHRRLLGLAAVGAALLAAAAASLVAWFGAAVPLRPLTRLRDAVRAISPSAPSAGELEAIEAPGEIEGIRAALVDLIRRLDHALGESRRFAADAAHELRTPLTTLRGELELIRETGRGEADDAALARACTNLDGLARLVERLLILASPGGTALPRDAVALIDVVEEARAALPETVRARVAVAVSDDGTVRGDASLLRALVSNALDNALKFSHGEVGVRVTEVAGQARLEIADDGPGIDPAEADQVFLPFYRAGGRGRGISGHGIGLSLIAHVAAAHGGRARFALAERGACLVVELPTWRPS